MKRTSKYSNRTVTAGVKNVEKNAETKANWSSNQGQIFEYQKSLFVWALDCMHTFMLWLRRQRKCKMKAPEVKTCDHYSEYYTQENDFTIFVWMMSLKQAISSTPSQIVSLNSRCITFIPILNSLKELKTICCAALFLKKLIAHAKIIFTFFFDESARSPTQKICL